MADTNFIDDATIIYADWLNDVNNLTYTIFGNPSSVNEARDALVLGTTDNVTFNRIAVGVNDAASGIIDVYGGATATIEGGQISLYTCADYDTTVDYFYMDVNQELLRFGGAGIGVKFQLDNNMTAGNTAMAIYDVDNATLERVTVGAADSGGAGFKVLRIAN